MRKITKQQIIDIFKKELVQSGRTIELVLPPPPQKKPKTADDLKMWKISGLPRCVSNNQIWRWATVQCAGPGCKIRFMPTDQPGRKRIYCSRRCQNRAHYKRGKQ